MRHIQDYDFLFEAEGTKFRRKPLAYALTSLAPLIDAETMKEHYGVHYKKYTDNLNEAVVEEKINVEMGPEMEGIKTILKNVDKYSDKVRNNGGGFYNHFLYFQNLSPEKKTPKGDLLNAIKKSFGGIPDLKKKMEEAGTGLFGSGWIWLVADTSIGIQEMDGCDMISAWLAKTPASRDTVHAWRRHYRPLA